MAVFEGAGHLSQAVISSRRHAMNLRRPWAAAVAQYAFVLWAALSLNFVLPRLMPGNPLELLAGTDLNALSADESATLLRDAGLDRPLVSQYGGYFRDLAVGNLGYSYQRNEPVASLVMRRLPWTLLLTITSQLVSLLIGVACAILAVRHYARVLDRLLMAVFLFIESLPVFWIGMLLLALLASEYPVFPAFGAVTVASGFAGWRWALDISHHLVLPVLTLSVAGAASTFLVARSSLITIRGEPFVSAARAKGLSGSQTLLRHVLPNALLPLVTVFGMNLASAVGGATLVETVFSYPGLGRLIFEAVRSRDYPVLQAAFLLITVVVVAANAFVELIYPLIDPRVGRREELVGRP
jgi:peptide/nickel transport system permease protein